MSFRRSVVIVAALLLALLVPSSGAASVARFGYRISGDEVKASVTGPLRTGAWRIRFVAPGRQQRTDFVLRAGDIFWTGIVRIARRTEAGWTTTRIYLLDRALAGKTSVAGCAASICWDSDDVRLPRDDDGRFGVTVRLTRSGTYRAVGAVRLACEAFQLGPWISSNSYLISR